jgi:hypothetical protein
MALARRRCLRLLIIESPPVDEFLEAGDRPEDTATILLPE